MKKVDLHIHTTASDGCWEPEDLIAEIKKAGVYLFSVTDHDTVAGIEPMIRLAAENSLNFVPGVELSSMHDKHMAHILGYEIDHKNVDLLKLCRINTEMVLNLNVEIMETLQKKGFKVDIEDFKYYLNNFDKKRGGGIVFTYMTERGHFKTFKEALNSIVKLVDWGNIPYPPVETVISTIKSAGGIPILAHPGSTLVGDPFDEEMLEYFVGAGVMGIECYTNYHDKEMTEKFLAFSRRHNLLTTAGSDCHGPLLVERRLGFPEVDISDLNLGGIWTEYTFPPP